MFPAPLIKKAEQLLAACGKKQEKLVTAESCTGGLISALFTEIPGSSSVFDRGFVTYSNQAKQELLGVDNALLEKHGAVSEQTAKAMAQGAMNRSGSDLAIAVTGIAGPGGGTPEKPVGLVYIAVLYKGKSTVEECRFSGNRAEIRLKSVEKALNMAQSVIA